jgi:hypothetical protein
MPVIGRASIEAGLEFLELAGILIRQVVCLTEIVVDIVLAGGPRHRWYLQNALPYTD